MLSSSQLTEYQNNGYVVLKEFLTGSECEMLRNRIDCIIDKFSTDLADETVPHEFYDVEDEKRFHDKHFLESGDQVRLFLEKNVDINKLKTREEIENNINKIGYALHALDPIYKQITFSPKVKDLFKCLHFKNPVVCQSCFIAKQPKLSGETKSHQDATFIDVEPSKVACVWIALQDCTEENGCLNFVNGSNKTLLRKKLIRNSNMEEFKKGNYLMYKDEIAEEVEPQYEPVPIKAGSAIVFDGKTIHKSGSNNSNNSRNVYAFNLYDSDNAKYSDLNWNPFNSKTFLPLY